MKIEDTNSGRRINEYREKTNSKEVKVLNNVKMEET